ncbi:GHMP family kinase ATP-binding protein [Affinirhizobium pseudoryzae]|uniref:GHMP family kinase ATP-binding protein n=1 Tax=Allorhizobium pseudoryzae TaxID=379684 RepID=UPI0013EAAE75|nr:dehydrogenase [Allorhizobium pseudoryzae]
MLSGGIRARAPLRLGLAGGGTDLSPFCDEHGGYVMNATVSLYAYVHLAPNSDGKLVFEAAEQGERFETDAIATVPLNPGTILHCGVYNRIIREFNAGKPLPLTIRTTVDVPAGSGMGGSSTLVVALVEAFRHYLSLPLGEYDIARLAFEIEREDLKVAGGRQDQYAAAFGGFNFMEFNSGNQTIINPLRMKASTIQELEASFVLYYTGRSRSSSLIIEAQQGQLKERNATSVEAMLSLKNEALEMKEALLTGRLDRIAEIMARGWLAKKQTATAVSNAEIDRILDLALENGGLAGKVSGAGGGGFVSIIASPSERYRVMNALRKEPGQLLPVVFTAEGVCSWRQTL